MAQSKWKVGRIFLWWACSAACLVALFQGSGSLSKFGTVGLAVFGSGTAIIAAIEHGWHRAPVPIGTPIKAVLLIALLSAPLTILGFYVWPRPIAPTRPAQPVYPELTWSDPAPITFGAALTTRELNAASPVSGTYIYNPTFGATLPVGTQTLSVTFTPSDTSQYLPANKTVALTVNPARSSSFQPHPTPPHPIITENRTSVLHDNATRRVTVTVVLWNTGDADVEADVSIGLFWNGVPMTPDHSTEKRRILFPAPSQRTQSGFLQEITVSGELTEDAYALFEGFNSPMTVQASATYLDGSQPTKFFFKGGVSGQNAFVSILEMSREPIKQE